MKRFGFPYLNRLILCHIMSYQYAFSVFSIIKWTARHKPLTIQILWVLDFLCYGNHPPTRCPMSIVAQPAWVLRGDKWFGRPDITSGTCKPIVSAESLNTASLNTKLFSWTVHYIQRVNSKKLMLFLWSNLWRGRKRHYNAPATKVQFFYYCTFFGTHPRPSHLPKPVHENQEGQERILLMAFILLSFTVIIYRQDFISFEQSMHYMQLIMRDVSYVLLTC